MTNSGFTRIFNGKWRKIKPGHFAYDLASNFCYLTKTPGYTPEPIEFTWQRKLTAEIKRQMTPGAIRAREKTNKRNKVGCGLGGGISPRCLNND